MWDRPGSGIELMSPTLADGFSTTEPPGKPFTLLGTDRLFSTSPIYLFFNVFKGAPIIQAVSRFEL